MGFESEVRGPQIEGLMWLGAGREGVGLTSCKLKWASPEICGGRRGGIWYWQKGRVEKVGGYLIRA